MAERRAHGAGDSQPTDAEREPTFPGLGNYLATPTIHNRVPTRFQAPAIRSLGAIIMQEVEVCNPGNAG
jgi:hypothetical protein